MEDALNLAADAFLLAGAAVLIGEMVKALGALVVLWIKGNEQ